MWSRSMLEMGLVRRRLILVTRNILLLDCIEVVLTAFTRPLILNPGDEIC